MKTHAIIPIFIPHRGCRHTCVFCNQNAITARQPDVTPEDVRKILDTWLSTMRRAEKDSPETGGLETIEAAFYGGSFTGLPMEDQAAFLAVLKDYKDDGRIDKIHLSTRPDYISVPILEQLRRFGTDTIELGVQSFDPEVLLASRRGHSVDDIYEACRLIRQFDFELGIQLMIGLPLDSKEKCIESARRTAQIKPELARLYPTVVLQDTELARMYARGEYRPLTTEEAVDITKDMYRILDAAGITIMRVGLKSTDLISDSSSDSQVQGHSYHPAFRQLVEGAIAREDLEEQLLQRLDRPAFAFTCCGASFSNMIGHSGCNKRYFAEKYPSLTIRYEVDETLPRNAYRALPTADQTSRRTQ